MKAIFYIVTVISSVLVEFGNMNSENKLGRFLSVSGIWVLFASVLFAFIKAGFLAGAICIGIAIVVRTIFQKLQQ